MKLSKNFELDEFTRSTKADDLNITNVPSALVIESLQSLVTNLLQPIRDTFGVAMHVNSGYRCKALNDAVGGVDTSQHMKGEAADIHTSDPVALYKFVRSSGLDYDQIILYPTFVHMSYKLHGTNRKQALYAKNVKPV